MGLGRGAGRPVARSRGWGSPQAVGLLRAWKGVSEWRSREMRCLLCVRAQATAGAVQQRSSRLTCATRVRRRQRAERRRRARTGRERGRRGEAMYVVDEAAWDGWRGEAPGGGVEVAPSRWCWVWA
jgi:hypothetical protein